MSLDNKRNCCPWASGKIDEAMLILSEYHQLHEILRGLVESEDQPCSFDHHGHCQEHGWFGEPGECYTRKARELLGL